MTQGVTSHAFRFRLERVRALRERAEDHAREELAASLTARAQGEAQLSAVRDALGEARAAQRPQPGHAGLSPIDLQARQLYVERVERLHQAAALDLDRRDAEVDARRTALQSAARDRQVLERLKERRRADHVRELERREGAELDEMALTVFRRAVAS